MVNTDMFIMYIAYQVFMGQTHLELENQKQRLV